MIKYVFLIIFFTAQLSFATTKLNYEQQILNYLNNIKTMVADFEQQAADGSKATGKVFLSRPGRLRWQYSPPTPLLIIVNGKQVIYYDYELNEATYFGLNKVGAAFLTRQSIDFKDKITKVNYNSEDKEVILEMQNINNQDEIFTKMILTLKTKPLKLYRMQFIDNDNNVTNVSFKNIQYDVILNKKLFTFDNPTIMRKEQ